MTTFFRVRHRQIDTHTSLGGIKDKYLQLDRGLIVSRVGKVLGQPPPKKKKEFQNRPWVVEFSVFPVCLDLGLGFGGKARA